MRAAVVGAGEVGTACALALRASGLQKVALLTRDVDFVQDAGHTVGTHEETRCDDVHGVFKAFRRKLPPMRVPAGVEVAHVGTRGSDTPAHVFICTPITSLLPSDDAWATSVFRGRHDPASSIYLSEWATRHRAQPGFSSENINSQMVCLFTRGLSVNGESPVELAEALVNGPSVSKKEYIPVLAVSGPLFAKEWAQQSYPESQGGGASAESATRASPSTATTGSAPPASIGVTSAFTYPHRFSGTALTFALHTPTLRGDMGRHTALQAQLEQLFARESMRYLADEDAADVLSLLNTCAPLCSLGAGMVSNVYAGGSVSALMAYAQHALTATEALLNGILDRTQGTPLPPCASSLLAMACTNYASREFVLGRQLDFHFRKQDALQAVYPGGTHHDFAATVDGLHVRMKDRQVASPFYEVLMDSYHTMVRSSLAGEGLVKEGYYDYRDNDYPSPLLSQLMRVDEAMLSGTDEAFEKAKKDLERAFSSPQTT